MLFRNAPFYSYAYTKINIQRERYYPSINPEAVVLTLRL
jgi:hypothetical protein